MNPHQLKRLFPNASQSVLQANKTDFGLPSPKPEYNKKTALVSAVSGETKSLPRITVCFIGYRVRPLDPDNFAGGCKDLLDGLRHANLISGDEPWRIKFETEQIKVKSYKEEKTVIIVQR